MASFSASDRWRQVESLFYQAVELQPAARAAFLEESCQGDQDLRKEVESLLASVDKPIDFLESPLREAALRFVTDSHPAVISRGTILAHYEVISRIGAGGMGEIYLAQDLTLKRKVALKILSAEWTFNERGLRRFEQEAQAASALNHPNILTIFEFGKVNGQHFIASEFVDGPTLREKLSQGKLDLQSTVDTAMQVAGALSAAHASGIVHRDIKPENIILRPDGIVKLLDFGIAKLMEDQSSWTSPSKVRITTKTQAGMVLGTAEYMSPEQARGGALDGRSDIFSLGTVMYEMLAGRVPFTGETSTDVIAAILTNDPPPLVEFAPDVPVELENIVRKAICKDREGRYQTAKDLAADLQDLKTEFQFQARQRRSKDSDDRQHAPLAPGQAVESDRFGAAKHPTARAAPIKTPLPFSSYLVSEHPNRLLALLATVLVVVLAAGYWAMHRTTASHSASRTLAVLPFRNLKQDPTTDFLGFSLADAIITKLGYVNTLTIRPSSSVDKYRNRTIDPRKVAAELNVDTLLTGSFIKDGDDLRITTQLIDVKPDKILWQDAMDVKYDKLLTVQDQVARQIIKGLELNLSSTETANLKSDSPINPQAYEYYLRGIDLYAMNDFPAAIEMLEKSVSIEPNYAPAWAHLGRSYTTNASLQFGGREQYEKAQAAYAKALALNPALLEPKIYMANLFTDTGRVEEAVPLLREALLHYPNSAEAHWELGYAYRFGGMLEQSAEECETARQHDPQVKISSAALNSYLYLGEYAKFLESLRANDSPYVLFYRGLAEYYLNHRSQAAADFDRAYDANPLLLPARVGKALSDAIAGRNSEGLELLHQTENDIEQRGVSDAEGIYKVAQAYAVLGDKASALRMFHKSIDGGFFPYPYFLRDPLLENIRKEPQFSWIMDHARERHEQFKAKFF